MQKILLAITFMPLMALILGCSDELAKAKGNTGADLNVGSFSKSTFTYDVQPGKEPNQYNVIFNWEKTSDLVQISLDGDSKSTTNSIDNRYSEIVMGGQAYLYTISILDSAKVLKEQFEVSVDVPRDQVLSGKIDYLGETVINANRLFIRGDAIVSTYRNNLVIKANEIISEGGTLQNYPWAYLDCPDKRTGNDGGDITIFAEKARGSLAVSMTGAKGCFAFGPGGAGGILKVSIENGQALKLTTETKSAPGADPVGSMYGPGIPGTQANVCISLSKDDQNVCR